ncbi:SCO7613 C-terminal domain-containing membrane protein [Microbacterium sp. K2]|uniref:SCO7613 C-terminal domain-containing membrane protein n=1 Tax=Microbacterium sp. K2 TaxID=3391827 RepID=UPI003EDACF49
MTATSAPSADASSITWGEAVARHLLDGGTCPVCQWALEGGCCARCGSDLRGPVGIEIWKASLAAAVAIRARDETLRRVPTVHTSVATTRVAVPLPDAPLSAGVAGPPSSPPPGKGARSAETPAQSSATLQSVLATAGAGLFAVAAIVFTYFNPDLADRALRSVIVGLITLLFLGGAWLLSRRGLRFSAEAVGGLGLVFAGLDVHAVAQLAAPQIEPWGTAAVATAAAAFVVLAAGRRFGIRIWQWVAVVALSIAPAMLGAAGGTALSGAVGAIGAAFAGAVIVEWRTLPVVERTTLVAVQLIAVVSALLLLVRIDGDMTTTLPTASALLLLIAMHAVIAARRMLRPLWSYAAGATGSAALMLGVYGVPGIRELDMSWHFAIAPAVASVALVLVGVLVPLPSRVPRAYTVAGALTVLAVPSAVLLMLAGITGGTTVIAFLRQGPGLTGEGIAGWGGPIGLAAVGGGLAAYASLARERGGARFFAVSASRLALAFAAIAMLVLGCGGLLVLPASVAVLIVTVLAISAMLRWMPHRTAGTGIRPILLIAAHLALASSVMVAWREAPIVPAAGVATLLAVAALAAVRPARWRFLYVGGGFAYGLVLVATALAEGGVDGIAQLCLTASSGLLVAIAATYLTAIDARTWQAILVVSAVPFGIGVLQVVIERSGWTALSTGLMFVLAMTLLLTRRPGLTLLVRTTAAGMLVPTLSVVVVCLGAQLLAASGSPIVLPIVAVVVALALTSSTLVKGVLVTRGHSARTADTARIAIEASALLTGAIATALALARDAAGLGTALLVLLIIGVGAVAAALFAARRYAWAVAGAAFTGALWCTWGIAGVAVLEAYLLPPTLGAALVGLLLTLRGRRSTALFSAGLLVAIAPLLAAVAVAGADADQPAVAWRIGGLLAASWALLISEMLLSRVRAGSRLHRVRALRIPILAAAALAATVGPLQGIRIGLGWDLPSVHGLALFLCCFGVSAAGAAALMLAGRGIRRAAADRSALRTARWLGAPAALALAVGTWFAIERDWFSVWPMWMLMLGYLVATVVIAHRVTQRGTTAPPVWFLFAIAFATAVVAWSPRDLRVEWFSLPLGAFLLLAGVIALRRQPSEQGGDRPTIDSWPGRWTGSWALLAPGIVTMMIASIVATFTDPLTWRAILVMMLALIAILAGSREQLAAPFLLGLVVLPIENVFVFSVQIGRGVESMPWWITLAVMGAVLLIIAVTAERRTGEGSGVAARVRDLR